MTPDGGLARGHVHRRMDRREASGEDDRRTRAGLGGVRAFGNFTTGCTLPSQDGGPREEGEPYRVQRPPSGGPWTIGLRPPRSIAATAPGVEGTCGACQGHGPRGYWDTGWPRPASASYRGTAPGVTSRCWPRNDRSGVDAGPARFGPRRPWPLRPGSFECSPTPHGGWHHGASGSCPSGDGRNHCPRAHGRQGWRPPAPSGLSPGYPGTGRPFTTPRR